MVTLSAFMDCAARAQIGLIVLTPVHTATEIGRNEANAVIRITVCWPFPNQITATGDHARDGIGSNTDKRGINNPSQKAYRPMKIPMETPKNAAMKKEIRSRHAVDRVCNRIGL